MLTKSMKRGILAMMNTLMKLIMVYILKSFHIYEDLRGPTLNPPSFFQTPSWRVGGFKVHFAVHLQHVFVKSDWMPRGIYNLFWAVHLPWQATKRCDSSSRRATTIVQASIMLQVLLNGGTTQTVHLLTRSSVFYHAMVTMVYSSPSCRGFCNHFWRDPIWMWKVLTLCYDWQSGKYRKSGKSEA